MQLETTQHGFIVTPESQDETTFLHSFFEAYTSFSQNITSRQKELEGTLFAQLVDNAHQTCHQAKIERINI